MQGAATSSGTIHSQVLTSLDDREALPRHALLNLVRDVAAEEVERAVSHVDERISPKISAKPLATMKRAPAN